MLGRDLVALLEPGHEVTAVDLDVDVTDAAAVDACVDACRPEAVFHLAAWTNVDGAEENEAAALAVNGEGSRNIARAAARVGAPLVLPSTDYVFAGTKGSPYVESDVPGPLGAYGRTKLAGEVAALEQWPQGTRIARTAWLYGRHGKNFVDTMRTLAADRDEVSVVDDQEGSPTWTCDLAPALVALLDAPAGIHHTAGQGSVTWAGFAEAIFDEAGLACRVKRITTAEMGRPAPRPAVSVLSVTNPATPRLRPWREALSDYIRETS